MGSNCAVGVDVDFYWAGCPSEFLEDHIEQAKDALFAALGERRQLLWNPHAEAMVKAEIKDRLRQAARGQLKPVDEVKSLRGGRDHLFEIRWQGIAITERLEDGTHRHVKTNLRLIFAEPPELSVAAVGLVAVEKPEGEEGKALQDAAINEAERRYHAGLPRRWGLNLRRQRS